MVYEVVHSDTATQRKPISIVSAAAWIITPDNFDAPRHFFAETANFRLKKQPSINARSPHAVPLGIVVFYEKDRKSSNSY